MGDGLRGAELCYRTMLLSVPSASLQEMTTTNMMMGMHWAAIQPCQELS